VRVRFFFIAREAAGAPSIRHSLHPLFIGCARNSGKTSGARRGEIAGVCLDCRHCEEQRDEAIQTFCCGTILDCFVASAPRNDGLAV